MVARKERVTLLDATKEITSPAASVKLPDGMYTSPFRSTAQIKISFVIFSSFDYVESAVDRFKKHYSEKLMREGHF